MLTPTGSSTSRPNSPTNQFLHEGSGDEGENSLLVPLPNTGMPPSSWVDRPFSFCGRTLSDHVSNGNVTALTLINAVTVLALACLGYSLNSELDRNGFNPLTFALLMLISTVAQGAIESNGVVFRKMKGKIDVAIQRIDPNQRRVNSESTLEIVAGDHSHEGIIADSIANPLTMNRVEKSICTVVRCLERIEPFFNWESRFGSELFLSLVNIQVNDPSFEGEEDLLTVNVVMCIQLLVRDGFNLAKIRRGHYVDFQSRALDRTRDSANRRLSPNTRDVFGKALAYGAQAGLGCLLTGFGGQYASEVPGLGELSFGLGTIMIFEGTGYFLAEGMRRALRQCTNRYRQRANFSSLNPRIPLSLAVLRRTIKVLHNFSTEASCVVVGFVPKEAFFPVLGVFMGLMSHRSSTNFEDYTLTDHTKITAESLEDAAAEHPVKRRAVKVNQATTGIFFTLYTAFFTYGLVVSDDKERAGIAVLLGSTAFFGIFTRWLQHRFKPGENGRLFNESVYQLLFNRYAVIPYYYALIAIGGAEGAALNGDTGVAYGANLAAQALFGMIIGANQTADFREVTFTPALFRAQALNLLIAVLRGYHPNPN